MWRSRSSDDDHDVADLDAATLGDQLDGLGQRAVEVEQVGDVVGAGELLHVDDRARVEHRPALGQRDHRERARHALGGQRRALQRVDGDVDLRRRAVADLLAVVEHRRLVLLALADDDDAVHAHGAEHQAHRVDGGLVGGDLVAEADHARGGQRGGLGRAHELEREVAVRSGRLGHGREPMRLARAASGQTRRSADDRDAARSSRPRPLRGEPQVQAVALPAELVDRPQRRLGLGQRRLAVQDAVGDRGGRRRVGQLVGGRRVGTGVEGDAAGLVGARVVEVPGDLDGVRADRADLDPARQRQDHLRQRHRAPQVRVGVGDALQVLHRP